jgi:hypothetical protein
MSLLPLFTAAKLSNKSFPVYYIESTAPINVDEDSNNDQAICSGSTTVGVGLANGGFGLTLRDNGLGGRLTLSANGLGLADNGLANGATGSRSVTMAGSAFSRQWSLS